MVKLKDGQWATYSWRLLMGAKMGRIYFKTSSARTGSEKTVQEFEPAEVLIDAEPGDHVLGAAEIADTTVALINTGRYLIVTNHPETANNRGVALWGKDEARRRYNAAIMGFGALSKTEDRSPPGLDSSAPARAEIAAAPEPIRPPGWGRF